MYYRDSLKSMLLETLKGFGAGLMISAIIGFFIAKGFNMDCIEYSLMFDMLFGPICAIYFCSKENVAGFMNSGAEKIYSGIINACFRGLAGGNVYSFIFGVVKLIIGFIILLPIAFYMAISYVINLFYFAIMSIFEKLNKLENKETLCATLDKAISILSLVITIIICILFLRMFK